MKAIQRVKKYIDKQGFNNSSFEKKNNLSNGYIGTQIKRNADLGEGVLNKILDNCLDLNPEWLLTGKGEMLKGELSKIEEPNANYSNSPQNIDYKEKYYQLLEENRDLRIKIEDLQEQQAIKSQDKQQTA